MIQATTDDAPKSGAITPASEIFKANVAYIATELDRMHKRIARLEADLEKCREFLEDQVDVVDGSYGEPSPNRAMQLVSMIDETLNGRPV